MQIANITYYSHANFDRLLIDSTQFLNDPLMNFSLSWLKILIFIRVIFSYYSSLILKYFMYLKWNLVMASLNHYELIIVTNKTLVLKQLIYKQIMISYYFDYIMTHSLFNQSHFIYINFLYYSQFACLHSEFLLFPWHFYQGLLID